MAICCNSPAATSTRVRKSAAVTSGKMGQREGALTPYWPFRGNRGSSKNRNRTLLSVSTEFDSICIGPSGPFSLNPYIWRLDRARRPRRASAIARPTLDLGRAVRALRGHDCICSASSLSPGRGGPGVAVGIGALRECSFPSVPDRRDDTPESPSSRSGRPGSIHLRLNLFPLVSLLTLGTWRPSPAGRQALKSRRHSIIEGPG
jgi:hypothetical protein